MSSTSKASNLKFWGMIKGTEKDYYIAEGQLEAEDDGVERGPDFEARGTGVNEYVYWVNDSSLSDWTQLPDLTTQDIAAS